VGFDYRSKIHNATWRSTWDWGLFIGGAVPPLIFGVAFGNLLQGVPFGFDDYLISTYTGTFWQLLNPFALLAGVVSSAMITMHGGMYLAHRTEGDIQRRAIRGAVGAACRHGAGIRRRRLWLKFGGIEGFVITSAIDPGALPDPLAKTVARSADGWWINYGKQPLLWLLPALGIAARWRRALVLHAAR
jgi:cytochrome d ubiquinol oxidase subunit II